MKYRWPKALGLKALGRMLSYLGICVAMAGVVLVGSAAAQTGSGALLGPAQTQKLLPQSVYFKGQSATTQIRNSGGVKFADGAYLLAVLVDTSGYSSEVAQKYQAYLITEDAIRIEGKRLPAGIYGVGFLSGDRFVVMDVGAHELLTVPSQTDATSKRPRPLQLTAAAGSYRLYEGRRYVTVEK